MSFLPIIKDIIPMVLPSSIHITRSTELNAAGTDQTDGMIRKGAIIGKSEKLCASVMLVLPHTTSAVRHHGSQETLIYAVAGHGTLVTHGGQTRHPLSPGDFAYIPSWTEHQSINDGDAEMTWVVVCSGGEPEVVNLKGWGEGESKSN